MIQRALILAGLLLTLGTPAYADAPPQPAVPAAQTHASQAAPQPPAQLAWQRVGAPLSMDA